MTKVFGNEENLENINATLESIRSSSESLHKNLIAIESGQGILHSLIYDKKFANDFSSTVANLSYTTEELKGENGLIANLNSASKNLREISEMLRGGEGTLGALLLDPSVYDSLKGVLEEAERSKLVRAAVRYLIESGDSEN